MKQFISSDIHLNHLAIQKYCPGRAVSESAKIEPTWDDVAQMNENIITNWNSVVSPSDHTFIIGDVAMGKIEGAPALIRRLNGTKTLIAGNHDVSLKRLIKNDPTLSDLFVSIHDYYEHTFTRENEKRSKIKLIMSHYPMMHWNGQGHGTLMLHGHLHGSPCAVRGRIKDVGLDTNNLFPYTLGSVVEELCKIEVTYDHHGEV